MATDIATTDELLIDETSQRATEHNSKTFGELLSEVGFEGVVLRPLSQFTIALHTRTLGSQERQEFIEWAEDQDAISHAADDQDGSVWLVSI